MDWGVHTSKVDQNIPNKIIHTAKYSAEWMVEKINKLRRKKLHKFKKATKTRKRSETGRRCMTQRDKLAKEIMEAKRHHDQRLAEKNRRGGVYR